METAPRVIHAQTPHSNYAGNAKPPPPCFAEIFVRWGWRGIERAYGSRTTLNRRWIAELGEKELKGARRAYNKRLSSIRGKKRRGK